MMFNEENTKTGVYILLLLTLLFTTLKILWRIFSEPEKDNTILEDPWISQNDRIVLEKLDPKLVETLDRLFKQPNYKRLQSRIERRLYVFPFLTYHKKDRLQVIRIINGVISEHFDKQVSDSIKNEWAQNRHQLFPHSLYEI